MFPRKARTRGKKLVGNGLLDEQVESVASCWEQAWRVNGKKAGSQDHQLLWTDLATAGSREKAPKLVGWWEEGLQLRRANRWSSAQDLPAMAEEPLAQRDTTKSRTGGREADKEKQVLNSKFSMCICEKVSWSLWTFGKYLQTGIYLGGGAKLTLTLSVETKFRTFLYGVPPKPPPQAKQL